MQSVILGIELKLIVIVCPASPLFISGSLNRIEMPVSKQSYVSLLSCIRQEFSFCPLLILTVRGLRFHENHCQKATHMLKRTSKNNLPIQCTSNLSSQLLAQSKMSPVCCIQAFINVIQAVICWGYVQNMQKLLIKAVFS